MKIGIILTTNEIETAWNAFRYMNTALEMGHTVTTFMMNSGVECEFIDHEFFNINHQIDLFIENGGTLFSCGTCLDFRKLRKKVKRSEITNMIACINLTENSDKIITF